MSPRAFVPTLIVAMALTAIVAVWLTRAQNVPQVPTAEQSEQRIVAFNCTESGGTYEDCRCDCSKAEATYEATYEEATGYCITAVGSPGGARGEEAKALLEFKMLKSSQ